MNTYFSCSLIFRGRYIERYSDGMIELFDDDLGEFYEPASKLQALFYVLFGGDAPPGVQD